MTDSFRRKHRIVVLGGGPGGYEAALAGAQLGADVTLIEREGVGGSTVLTDVVPSKSLIATADAVTAVRESGQLGVQTYVRGENDRPTRPEIAINAAMINKRIMSMAAAQSEDMRNTLEDAGVRIVQGAGRFDGPNQVVVSTGNGGKDFDHLEADTFVEYRLGLARENSTPQNLTVSAFLPGNNCMKCSHCPSISSWLVQVLLGAEFASAYRILGSEVTLVSSREHVLPGEDRDAADLIENVFKRSGMNVLSKSRAKTVTRTDKGVRVELEDGRIVEGSHCLMAVGSVPNTAGIGLETTGIETTESGHIVVNKVASTNVPSIYAAGDCTNFYPLASVAAMQGRTAIMHALGDFVRPIDLRNVAANIFTSPEIATVGFSEADLPGLEELEAKSSVELLPLARNPRAKMQGIKEGFVKIFASQRTGVVRGAVIVAPRASELIFPLALAVEHPTPPLIRSRLRSRCTRRSPGQSVTCLARSMCASFLQVQQEES